MAIITSCRQGSTFLAVVENYGRAQELATEAVENQGFALKQNEKFIESIQGRLNLFKTTLQELARDLITSDMFKTIIDGGTIFLKMLIQIEKSIGLLNIALGVTGGLLAGKLLMSSSKFAFVMVGLAESIGLTATAVGGLTIALGVGLPLAIVGIVKLIDHFNVTLEENKTLLDENTSEMDKLEKQIKKLTESEEELSKQDELRLKSAEAQIKLTKIRNDELEKLIATQEAQAIAFKSGGSQFLGMDEGSINQLKLMQDQLQEFNDIQNGAKEATEKYALELETGLIDNLEELNSIFAILDDEALIAIFGETRFRELVAYRNELNNLFGVAINVDDAMQSYNDALYGVTEAEEAQQEALELTIEQLDTLARLYPHYAESVIDSEIAATTATIEATQERLHSMGIEIDAMKELINARAIAGKMGGTYFPAQDEIATLDLAIAKLDSLEGIQKKYFSTSKKSKKETIDLMDSYKSLFNTLSDNEQTISTINSAMSRMTDEEKIRGNQRLIEEYENQKTIIEQITTAMQAQIDSGKLTTEQNRELTEAIYDHNNAWQSASSAIFDAQQAIKDYNTKAAEELKKVREQQKEDIQDLIELTETYIKQGIENEIEALEDQVDAYKNIIDARKESIQLAEDELDLQEDLADKQKDISKLQSKIADLSQDDSRESQAKRLELEEQLADETKSLNEIQREAEVDLRTSALDKELEAFEDEKEDEIDVLKDQLSDAVSITKRAMDKINDNISSEGSELYNALIDWNAQYGTSVEDDIVSAWKKAKDAISDYSGTLATVDVGTTLSNISNVVSDDTGEVNKSDVISQMKSNSSRWAGASDEERDKLHLENQILGSSIGVSFDSSSGRWLDEGGIPVYGNGTFADTPHLALVGDRPEFIIPQTDIMDFVGRVNTVTNLPQIQSQNDSSNVKFDNLLTINGSVDSTVLPQLEAMVVKAADLATQKINDSFNKRGNFRGVKSFSQ